MNPTSLPRKENNSQTNAGEWSESRSVVPDSLRHHGLSIEFSRPEYGVGSLSLLQGIFPTQGLNPGLPHCRWILSQLSYQGSPVNAGEGVKKRKPSYTVCGNVNWYSLYGKQCEAFLKKLKIELPNDSAILFLDIYLKEMKALAWKEMCTSMFIATLFIITKTQKAFPGGSDNREPACSAAGLGSITGPGRSPGEGTGNLLQHSWLENSMDRGAWWATVHRVVQSQTPLKWLSMHVQDIMYSTVNNINNTVSCIWKLLRK